LIFSSLSDYMHSLFIEKYRGTKKAKYLLISSIVINLAMLGFFKYAGFFVENINLITGLGLPVPQIELPIGISFFTFQTMSYTIDVYRGAVHAEKNLATLGTYVCLFPQLVAGPIVRYITVAEELSERTHSIERTTVGIVRFAVGLGKKVLIANQMGELCSVFAASDDKSVLFYWIYAIAYTLQIYFDFSGYSDMAIGLGYMFGFTFPENFDYPYMSQSITEFWRRWHMTLGSWFRDYVYIPLGGNRVSKLKWLRNIMVVWFLTGFWHGAAWNFIAWGLMFGIILMIEKLWFGKVLQKIPRIFRHIYVMFLVIISFVIFNASDGTPTLECLAGMFGLIQIPAVSFEALYNLRSFAVILVAAVIGSTPLLKNLVLKIKDSNAGSAALVVIQPVFIAVCIIIAAAYLIDGAFNPFLYFRF